MDGVIYVDDPDDTLSFYGTQVRMGGNLYVYDTQRTIGFNASVGMAPTRYSDDLYSQDGNALSHWTDCNIGGIGYAMSSESRRSNECVFMGIPISLPGFSKKTGLCANNLPFP